MQLYVIDYLVDDASFKLVQQTNTNSYKWKKLGTSLLCGKIQTHI